MRIMRNCVLCFATVSMMSVPCVQAHSINFRLPDEARQKQVESPVPSSENEKAGTPSDESRAVDALSARDAETAVTQATDKGRPTACTVSLQVADNTARMDKDEKKGTSSPQQTKKEKQRKKPATKKGVLLEKGIGIQSGIRFHRPKKFNDFLTEYYNAFIPENLVGPVDKKSIGPGLFLTLNGTFDIGPLFQVTPFAQGMWAGKQIYFRGGLTKDVHINSYTAMGGLNLWVRLLKGDRTTLRLGAGAYGAYTIVSFTGDIAGTRVSGGGFGFKGLLGTELRLNQRVVLTFDCGVPYGVSKIKNHGSLRTPGPSVKYPSKLEHFGFELLPGVMFYF